MNNSMTSYSITDDTFSFVSSVTVTTIAVIGNSVVFIISLKQAFRKEPLFRYLIIGTIFDTLNVLLIWPSLFRDIFSINQLRWACVSYWYFNQIISFFTSWINALISVDTFLLVKNSTKFKFRENYKHQIAILLISFFCCMFDKFTIPFFGR
jgi:hypothetical protein